MAIELTKEEVKEIVPPIQKYAEAELGDDKAPFILDYFLKEIGPYAYSQGVRHAERYFREKIEDLPGSCYEHGFTYWPEKQNMG